MSLGAFIEYIEMIPESISDRLKHLISPVYQLARCFFAVAPLRWLQLPHEGPKYVREALVSHLGVRGLEETITIRAGDPGGRGEDKRWVRRYRTSVYRKSTALSLE